MDRKQVYELYKQASEKMDSSDFSNALRLTREIQSAGEDHFVSYIASGLLIDIGSALSSEEIITEGIDLLERDFKAIVYDEQYAVTAHYNLANGYSALFDLKRIEDPYAACFKETELASARFHYERALEYHSQDPMIISQIWVNLGNCFDTLGRVIDALECYEKALRWKQDHGMALGNKGIGLYSYAMVAGEHQGTFLIEAYSLISQALKQGVPIEKIPYFEKYLKEIKNRFKGRQHLLDNPPRYPGYRIKAKSKIERFLVEFCLENKLYLNICNYCQRCDAAIGDTAVIKKMIVPIGNLTKKDKLEGDQYLRLSGYLNQIKQDYGTARFLLALSRCAEFNIDFVDKRVKIIDTLDYSIHNIYVELVKTSFGGFYNILDKIAFFINDYLELHIPDEQISFRRVWYRNLRNRDKGIRKEIQNTNSFSLNAIFDLHRDLDVGTHKQLTQIRNQLTHRFINVRMLQGSEDAEKMTEDVLVSRTLELTKLVRNAILYLLQFVYIEESKKQAETEGFVPTMFAQELPDNLKGYR